MFVFYYCIPNKTLHVKVPGVPQIKCTVTCVFKFMYALHNVMRHPSSITWLSLTVCGPPIFHTFHTLLTTDQGAMFAKTGHDHSKSTISSPCLAMAS